jgi:hypothetical protein
MPYDEFGNFIPDELALDEMYYELAAKGRMPLRPGGSDVPYVASEVPQTYVAKPPPRPASTATNVPQAIADRLGISAIPQAALGMISSFPAAVARETGFDKFADAIQYTPTSKAGSEILEGVSQLPQVVTGSHMGVGALPEFFVPRRAFGLQGRPMLTPDDVRVMGGRVAETGREIRNIPEDFRAGQQGFRRESNVFDGETIGSRAQRVADDLGDVIARREMQGLTPIPGIPDIVSPETRMYAVRQPNAGQMIKETDLPDIKYVEANPKVKTVGLKFEEELPYVDEAFPNQTRAEYYRNIIERNPALEAAYRSYADDVYMQMFPDAPSIDAARAAYNNTGSQKSLALDQIRILSEFAESPEAMYALEYQAEQRERAVEEYNRVKNASKKEITEGLTDEEAKRQAKEAHQAKIDELELNLIEKDYAPELNQAQYLKRITPPNSTEYMRRANAARKYILGEFRNDIAKYIGTSQGPQMELAKRGITIPSKKDLLENLKQITSGGSDLRDLKAKRTAAGFNPEGEMQPLIIKAEAELSQQQETLNELNAKRNALRQQHYLMMPEEPDPAKNPTEIGAEYRALKNPMSAIIDKMAKTRKQLENFTIANAYETISDIAFVPKTAKQFKEEIPYGERGFFPNLFPPPGSKELSKTPDEAPMFNVRIKGMRDLGIDFLAEQYTKAMLDGRVPVDDKGKPTVSVEKFIEQITKRRLKEEEKADIEKNKSMSNLNDYAQNTIASIPPELRFKNASAIELTSDNPKDVIRRQVSFDCMVLDNCVAATDAPHPGINPFTNQRYNYSYPVDPATGKTRGSKVRDSGYMTAIAEGQQRYASLRDNTSALPSVNINMLKTSDSTSDAPKYNLQYVSGYQNDKIDRKYTEDVRDYLNLRSDIIQGSGSALDKWGIYDLNSQGGKAAASRALGVPNNALGSFDLPRFVTEKDLRDLANRQPVGDTHADLVAARSRASQELQTLIREYGIGAPETQDVASQLVDIEARLNAISTQVRSAPSTAIELARPSLFQRMTTEALTNGLGQEDGGIGPVRARVDDLLTEDFYGLRELWSDDYEFYPIALRNFVNGVRNNENLAPILTHANDTSTFANDMRERLTRFQDRIQDFTPMQRELFVRELDNYAETNINQLAENLDPENTLRGLEEIEDTHPGTIEYLRQIETRRRGRDFTPEAAPAQAAMRAPRDIADIVTPLAHPDRQNLIQTITERLNNSIRDLPQDRETLQEALAQYQRNPLDIPGSIEMELPPDNGFGSANTARRAISDYLIQQIQNRLGGFTPEGGTRAAPALPPVNDPTIVDLANQIVPFNAAFRNQTVEDIRNAIREQLLPSIGIYNPNNPQDRRNLLQISEAYQNSPLDVDLGQRLETYIGASPALENSRREYIADFMIDQIQRRLDAQPQAPQLQGVPQRSTAVMNMVGTLAAELYRDAEANRFDTADLTSTLHALDARNFDHPMVRALPEADRAAAQEDTAATLRLILQNRNINIPIDIFAGEAPLDPRINAYRDGYTNELTGSRRAFDEVMQAERITPGAINEAILRTDGNARYDEDIRNFYRVDSPAGISQLNNALRQYMEGNGFDTPPRPVEERRPARQDEYVYDPDDMMTEIDYEMERQERILTRNQYGQLDDLVDEIQREAGDNFEDLIDTIDRIRMRTGVDGDVDIALGDLRARLVRTEEESRLEFDRQQRNRDVVVEPEAALRGAIDGAREIYGPEMGAEIVDLVDNLINDDIRFDREPDQFIARLRDESNEYEGHNQGYSDAVREMADFLENYMRERAARPRGRKRGGYVKKMNGGGKVEPSSPATSVNDHRKPVEPVKKINNPDAPEFKEIFNRERANRGSSSGGGSGAPADLKQIMNPRNITYNAGGKVSIDQMRYELLRK